MFAAVSKRMGRPDHMLLTGLIGDKLS